MSGNYVHEGRGGPMPNGKIHLKFPFRLFAPFPCADIESCPSICYKNFETPCIGYRLLAQEN